MYKYTYVHKIEEKHYVYMMRICIKLFSPIRKKKYIKIEEKKTQQIPEPLAGATPNESKVLSITLKSQKKKKRMEKQKMKKKKRKRKIKTAPSTL